MRAAPPDTKTEQLSAICAGQERSKVYHIEVRQQGEVVHEAFIEDEVSVSEALIAAAWQSVIDRIDQRIVPLDEVTEVFYGPTATRGDSE